MKIRVSVVNPKSSNYMCIDKSESEKCIENSVESINTHKRAMSVQVSKQDIGKSRVII